MVNFLKYGVTHAITRDLLFLLIYNIVGYNGIIGKTEMILSFLIPTILSSIIISKLYDINYIIPILISSITLFIPNLIPNLILLTYYKNKSELAYPIGISIMCYVILYLLFSLFI